LHRLRKLASLIDSLNERVGTFTGWLTSILVLTVCYDVFTRYLLNESQIAVQELEWHLFSLIFLLGAAFTLRHDRHVRVDVIYINFSERTRAWVNLAGSLLFLIPFAVIVIKSSQNFVINSFMIQETSADPGGLPARFILKSCIPIGFVLVLLQAISQFIHSLTQITETHIEKPAQAQND